jgi:dUTP pyrophosphatase
MDTTETDTQDNTQEPCTAKIILLSDHAKISTRATDGSAGYDLYSPRDTIIKPGQRAIIPTDISITPPEGTYIQIHPRSSLAAKYNIDTKAGVIDADFIGNITVVLQNSGQHDFHITMGDGIAQIIYTKISTPQHTLVPTLDQTQRGTSGFSSSNSTATIRQTEANHQLEPRLETPTYIYMSNDPFDDILTITIPIKGDHQTLGMLLQICPHRNRLQLHNMAPNTPGSCVQKWRSTI